MAEIARRQIPLAIFVGATFWIFFEFFLQIPGGPAITGELSRWVTCIANFAMLLGALNLIRIQGRYVIRQREGEWIHGVITLGSLLIMFFAGLVYKPVFTWLYDVIYIGLNKALMCYVGFYYFSAMYRTFKVRSVEALLTLAAAIGMLFANAPVSGAIWGPLPQIGLWIADVPGMGAWRGFIMSPAMGMFAMAIRAAMGLERAYIGGGGGEE
jgi:hypothetical protein